MAVVTKVVGNKKGNGEGAREGGMINDNSFLGGERRAQGRKNKLGPQKGDGILELLRRMSRVISTTPEVGFGVGFKR